MATSVESLNLINELLESVRDLGVKGVTTLLQNARGNTLTIGDKNVDFVLRAVSNYYKIPAEEIIYSKNKLVKRKIALAFSVYYLHNTFQYSLSSMNHLFRRDKALLSRLNAMIKNELKKHNEKIFEAKVKLDNEVNNYINNKES